MRLAAVAVLAYVGADFLDPSVPGVFFFDSERLFVDSAVQTKTDTHTMAVAAPSEPDRPFDAPELSPSMPPPGHGEVVTSARSPSHLFARSQLGRSADPDSTPH
jgi:hypothetical protein